MAERADGLATRMQRATEDMASNDVVNLEQSGGERNKEKKGS